MNMVKPAVARLWEGRTKASLAEDYANYLLENGVGKLRRMNGNLGVQAFQRIENDVAYFATISYWESRDAIKAFAGDDIEKPHHLPKDAEYLLELPQAVKHFDVLLNDWSEDETEYLP